jgi:hypothetical protein
MKPPSRLAKPRGVAGQIGKLPSNLGLPVVKPPKPPKPLGNVGTAPKNSGRRPR